MLTQPHAPSGCLQVSPCRNSKFKVHIGTTRNCICDGEKIVFCTPRNPIASSKNVQPQRTHAHSQELAKILKSRYFGVILVVFWDWVGDLGLNPNPCRWFEISSELRLYNVTLGRISKCGYRKNYSHKWKMVVKLGSRKWRSPVHWNGFCFKFQMEF